MIRVLFFMMQLMFFNHIILGEESQVILELKTRKGTDTMRVDSDTKELYFEKSYLQSIQGLDKLHKLETIVFDMTAFIKDFSFLEDAPHLKKAVFVLVHPDNWAFIERLPNIESIHIRACDIKNIRLDLINNERLKYLEISSSGLDSYPELINIPLSLEYLNLAYNEIKFIPEYKKYHGNFVTILFRNNIEYFESKYIVFADPESILPAQYIVNNVSH